MQLQTFPLPQEILLFLLEYVESNDQVELISCCKVWYYSLMKKFVRKLHFTHLSNGHDFDVGVIVDRTKRLVSQSFRQVSVSLSNDLLNHNLRKLLDGLNYEVHSLRCNEINFLHVINSPIPLKVKELALTWNVNNSEQAISDMDVYLSKVINCESLTVKFPCNSVVTSLPYIPSLKHLSLLYVTIGSSIETSIHLYCQTLHQLSLNQCSISDVSMLGSIPHLELKYCHNVVDISALNHNDTVIIEDCKSIQDYSRSFAHSRKIEISLFRKDRYHFDLTRWNTVEDLVLLLYVDDDSRQCLIFANDNAQLPRNVKKCLLGGVFVSAIDFTVTSDHSLHKLVLSNNYSITSLEGCGLDRIAIIECFHLNKLQSLQGLGRGKNRKVTIRYCQEITDFSPLNHVPIVKIDRCSGCTDPLQLRKVRDLTLLPPVEISFQSDIDPYEHVHSLTTRFLSCFDGLERIPYLQLNFSSYRLIKQFLEEGKKLQNRRIVLILDGSRQYRKSIRYDNVFELHNKYLTDRYDYYNKLPDAWIWVMKTL